MWRRAWHRAVATLRRDFVAGLLVFVPVGFTVLGILWIVEQLDKLVLPKVFGVLGLQTRQPPIVGAVATLCVILLAGAATRSFVGRRLLRLWEYTVVRIPVAGSLYSILKQFMEAIVGGPGVQANFRRVVLVEYPRKGIFTYAFVTGPSRQSQSELPENLVKIFAPKTPNPTTGYLMLVPEHELIDTGLSVEQAFKLIVSAGIVDEEVPAPGVVGPG